MFKYVAVALSVVIFVTNAAPAPKPGVVAAAYTSPVVAPAFVTAQSSQVIARNYNTLASPLVAAYAAPIGYSAPIVNAAPLLHHAAPLGYSAPLFKAAPLVASAPLAYASLLAGPSYYL